MKKVYKALLVALALAGAATAAVAQQGKPADGGKAPQSFAERKQLMLQRMDQRIQAMQKARDCISQAQDEQAARACRQPHGPRAGGKAHEGHMGGDHMAAHMAEHMAHQGEGEHEAH
jgi:hypothetical protein